MEEGRIQGHMVPTVGSTLRIKSECIRVVLAETLCTFIMMVFGLGSVAQVVTGSGAFGEYLSINVGFGLGVAMGVHIGGKVSDAIHHYCGGNLTVSGPKATAGIFATYPAPYISIYTGFLDQVLGTAMLLLCLMAFADQRNQPVVPGGEPVGVGLLVLLIGISLGSNSGYAINPSRDLGPRVFTLMAGWGLEVFRAGNGWWWVPLVAPLFGGVIGALIYKAFVELHHLHHYNDIKTQSIRDPECVPLDKCKNSSTEICV
ncbi:aquaporin-7-like isoform X2 [Myxocyprinus asiaticus]|uniref:aquaporin-7-like isoform X2 n=1 Tax=Myxocyprinus asiaticus TaxID=70543 RepID=UPI002221A1A4|nr:aquaporin-7-like isoform X2 [Myxocyprinus asiaticus]